jgi:DNA-binding transcriptional MerR regulator
MGFTSKQVCDISGVSARCLRYWTEVGLVQASASKRNTIRKTVGYNLRDILTVLVIKQLRDKGLSLQRIKESVKRVKKVWGYDNPLVQLRVACLTQSIIFKRDGSYIEALSGQHVFGIAVDEIRNAVGQKRSGPTKRMIERQTEMFIRKVWEM